MQGLYGKDTIDFAILNRVFERLRECTTEREFLRLCQSVLDGDAMLVDDSPVSAMCELKSYGAAVKQVPPKLQQVLLKNLSIRVLLCHTLVPHDD